MRPHRALVLLLACLWGPASEAVAAEPAALARSRALYNAGNYDEAIEAASAARQEPQWADAASLVVARSQLERGRLRNDPADLVSARDTLSAIRAAALAPRDQLDLLIGFGQALYLGDGFGAAADVFETALGRTSMLSSRDRLLLLEWWATALDREAQSQPADRRAGLFARVADRMTEDLRQDPGSRVANYWLIVAARGSGDLDRAWDAAVAGWVRASLSPDTVTLRADLDRLVGTALIPERARLRPAREQADALRALRAEWDQVKEDWK
jgi:hypothetical protein